MTNFFQISYINFDTLGKLLLFLGIFVLTRLMMNLKNKPMINPIPEKVLVKLGDETASFSINLHVVISLLLAFALIAIKLLDQYIKF